MAKHTLRRRRALLTLACIAAALLAGCAADHETGDRCAEIEAQALERLQRATATPMSDDEQEFEQLTAINLALDNPECFSAEAVAAARARKEQLLGATEPTP